MPRLFVCRFKVRITRTSLDPNQMSRLSCQKPVDSKFTEPKPLVIYHGWGQRWKLSAHHKRHSKRRQSSSCRKRCRWSGTACLGDRLTRLLRSFQSDRRLALKLRLDILNILSDCRIVTFCCCCLNDVIYCVFARTFPSALKSLVGNTAMLIIILIVCMIIKLC